MKTAQVYRRDLIKSALNHLMEMSRAVLSPIVSLIEDGLDFVSQ